MKLSRRSFLGGTIALTVVAVALPQFSKSLPTPRIVGDGVHDDTAGLQAMFDGLPFIVDGDFIQDAGEITISGGTFQISDTLHVTGSRPIRLIGNHFIASGMNGKPMLHFHTPVPVEIA